MMLKIEVCCGSADDVSRAALAGADRVELNSALFAGGLTPSLGSLIQARKMVKIPIICMLRPRAGGFCYSEVEFQTMLTDIRALANAGADGFALGCLTQDGELDRARCQKLIATAGGKEVVFHRAFDCMQTHAVETLHDLAELGFKRVLTSGRKPTAQEGRDLIRDLHALSLIEVLPGSGIRRIDLVEFLTYTGCDQVHLTYHDLEKDLSIKNLEISFAGCTPPDDSFSVINIAGLSHFINQFR